MGSSLTKSLERCFIATGVALLALAGGARLAGEIQKQRDLRRFDAAASAEAAGTSQAGTAAPAPRPGVDTSLWSPERIKAYEASLRRDFGMPLAVLSIPKIGLEVPVLDGTDDLTLNRGVGLIEGTARPGDAGNVGIAGHRDGFFRGLKDVGAGDTIEIKTLSGREHFVIDFVRIVSPDEIHVLDPTAAPVLTLVTCYPFYFVGSAPQRYVVRAIRRGAVSGPDPPVTNSGASFTNIRKEAASPGKEQ